MVKQKQNTSLSVTHVPAFPQRIISLLAEEIAKTLERRMQVLRPVGVRRKTKKKIKKLENPVFLDTSAIIDSRIFDLIQLGILTGTFVITDSILRELKHIADSQDTVRRERGRMGLEKLERLKRNRGIKVHILKEEYTDNNGKPGEVDERIIKAAKQHRGRIITCDYNLDKKANIDGVTAININSLAHVLKIVAVPGEALHIKVQHTGKEDSQGVGYLDDGTMIVVEQGREDIGRSLDVVVSRVIQTTSGRILFAKKI